MQSTSDVSINDEAPTEIDNIPTAVDTSNFLFTLQQPTKKLYHPDYKRILDNFKVSPKTGSSGKKPKKPRKKDDQQHGSSFEGGAIARRIKKLSTSEQEKLGKIYTSGPAAHGRASNLRQPSKMSKSKVGSFCNKKTPIQNTDKFNVFSLT